MKHIRMGKDTADRWLAALRSGEYKQAKGRLEADGHYCCLGVLQKVISGYTRGGSGYACPNLPDRNWLDEHGIAFLLDGGKSYTNPFIEAVGDTLSEVNDSGKDFLEIADLIEGELQYTDGKKER